MAILHCDKVSNLHVTDISAPVFQKTGFTITNTVVGTSSIPAVHTIETIAESAGNLNYKAFTLNSHNNELSFYLYFKVDGVDRDPLFGDNRMRIVVPISSGATDEQVADAISLKFTSGYAEGYHKLLSEYFTATNVTNTVTITNKVQGETIAMLDGGDTAYELEDARDGTDASVTNLKAVTGWVWEIKDAGNSGLRTVKRQKWMKLIVNLDGNDVKISY